MNEFHSPLLAWESFYVIVGSAAAGLTGLQFIVMTLIGEGIGGGTRQETLSAFGSPNVVHFCAALLVSAILSAPWPTLGSVGIALTLCGVGGVIYSGVIIRRTHQQSSYTPVLEDWVWHNVLPMLAYSSLLITGVALRWATTYELFVIGAAVLLLVFIGIHNAWDTVTYVIVLQRTQRRERERKARLAATPGTPPSDSDPE